MKDRIKKIRKAFDLTQQAFAKRLGAKRNNIAGYEIGSRSPSDAVISLICREFNINEEWLRNSTGGMFFPENRQNEIEQILKNLLSEEKDSFKSRFITMLSKLSTSDWERLELEAMPLLNIKKEKDWNHFNSIDTKTEINNAELEYIKNISNSAQNMVSTAWNTTEDIQKTTDTTNKAPNH